MTTLADWFSVRPKWLQKATIMLRDNGDLNNEQLQELTDLCKQESGHHGGLAVDTDELKDSLKSFDMIAENSSIKIKSVSDVVGVNALAPRKPLDFGDNPLVIVYGNNGSGKSGYMRMLKHICGCRAAGTLHGNVFSGNSEEKKCNITFQIDENDLVTEEWKETEGSIDKLRGTSIYDTSCARVYIDDEHEITYEPPLLRLFRMLVAISQRVDKKIGEEIDSMKGKLPPLPNEWKETESGKWYTNINDKTSRDELSKYCEWGQTLEKDLTGLNKRLAETAPAEKAKSLRKTKKNISDLIDLLEKITNELNDQAFDEFLKLKQDVEKKKRVAREDADKVFSNAPLKGVASESWKLLWEQARAYSTSEAYKEMAFPNIKDDARCVLCQQELDDTAKNRLQAFENFVRGNLANESTIVQKTFETLQERWTDIPSEKVLKEKIELCQINDETTQQPINTYCVKLKARRENFSQTDDVSKLPKLPENEIIETLKQKMEELEEQAKKLDKDAKGDNRDELRNKKLELEARKWISERKDEIENEISRCEKIAELKAARKLTDTTALSRKASTLSEQLVTEAFRKRFEDELKKLGASKIQVEITKTRAHRGQVFHKVRLRESKFSNTTEILSEGEFRIVSLAAFLADVTATESRAPFIFDDPISSLDQDYEELTAKRLVELAKKRQVIVFTHRLSLLATISETTKKMDIEQNVIGLYVEPWGTGEPGGPPLPAQNPKKALNALANQHLSDAEKIYQNDGTEKYHPIVKGLCSDIRITIERLIEHVLMADVVQRFRRPITTVGKIENLAKIESKDCQLFDEMMTKYSRYEHWQPNEAPVQLPEPDEIRQDLTKLTDWLNEFSKRDVTMT